MRLFVLGATGRTGVELLDLALARGHHVTAFVRSPAKIARRDPGLAIVKGNLFDASEVARSMAGHDAVISALGPRAGQVMRGMTLMKDSAESVLPAMNAAQVRRFLVVSSALAFPGGSLGARFFRTLIGSHVRDLRNMEDLIRQGTLAWTIARPPRLIRTREEGYRAVVDGLPEPFSARPATSWRSVAAFLLDAAERDLYARRIVGLGRVRGGAEAGPA